MTVFHWFLPGNTMGVDFRAGFEQALPADLRESSSVGLSFSILETKQGEQGEISRYKDVWGGASVKQTQLILTKAFSTSFTCLVARSLFMVFFRPLFWVKQKHGWGGWRHKKSHEQVLPNLWRPTKLAQIELDQLGPRISAKCLKHHLVPAFVSFFCSSR